MSLNEIAIESSDGHEVWANLDERSMELWSVEVVTSIEAFAALEKEWSCLVRAADSPAAAFLSHAYLLAWARRFADPASSDSWELRIVTIRDGEDLIFAWLLACAPGLVKVLRWMGAPVTQYGDALVAPGRDAGRLAEIAWWSLVNRDDIDAVDLTHVRADAAIASSLLGTMRRIGPMEAAPFVALDDIADRAAFWATLSKSRRKSLRRNRRDLERHGTVAFATYEAGPHAWRLTVKAIRQKFEWLFHQGLSSSVFTDPRVLNFICDLAMDHNADSGFIVHAITVDGRPASIEVGFRCGTHYLAFLGSYDSSVARCGPGNLQIGDTIGWCIKSGLGTCDLLAPASPYKQSWASGAVAVSRYALALSPRGHLYLAYADRVRPHLRSGFQGLPGWLRRWCASEFGGVKDDFEPDSNVKACTG